MNEYEKNKIYKGYNFYINHWTKYVCALIKLCKINKVK